MKRSIPPIERTAIKELILRFVRVGYHHRGAAKAAGIHRVTLYRWLSVDAPFASRFGQVWEEGSKRREFLAWCAHPFRGYRPPTGKGTRTFPRFGPPRLSGRRPR